MEESVKVKLVMDKRNSLLYWLPRAAKAGIPFPKTVVLEVNWGFDYVRFIEEPFPKDLVEQIRYTVKEIGYPLFMRTDYLSGKHCFEKWVPYVSCEEELFDNLRLLLEESATAGILGLPVNALVFREFVELDAGFKAFAGQPIAPERRYFVKDGKVLCHHPYWVEEAIEFYGVTPPNNWREKLREMNTESEEEVRLLTRYAEAIGSRVEGYWSIDFALRRDKKWIFIDMALGEVSWHPECSRRYNS